MTCMYCKAYAKSNHVCKECQAMSERLAEDLRIQELNEK